MPIRVKKQRQASGFSFTIIQTDNGTSPTADNTNDTVTYTSSDSSITITGDSGADTVDFIVNTEFIQDNIGAMFTDSSTIDFTYNDGANTITASVIQAAIDHGSIGGLTDDDHTQYALLAGRSGGQTLIGGTAASNNLTLQSTSNGTKGKIIFGTSAYDEVNNRLGIGNAAPSTTVDVTGDLRTSKRITTGVVALSDAATVSLDASLGNTFTLSAVGDRTIDIPTNPVNGQRITIIHNAVSSTRTLSLTTGSSGSFQFGTDITTLTGTTSGTRDYIGCIYNSTTQRWHVIAYSKGHS